MFTGIVTETGKIRALQASPDGQRLSIGSESLSQQLEIGHSVSVNGVCLTVEEVAEGAFWVSISPESLRLSNLGELAVGDPVNLEPAAKLSDFLGGHLVQGHVDGTGRLIQIKPEGNSSVYRFSAPHEVLRYCVYKGSVTVNGVSLTLSGLDSEWFEVTLIPHTLAITNLDSLKEGDAVNLEADVISKYVERHIKGDLDSGPDLLTLASGER